MKGVLPAAIVSLVLLGGILALAAKQEDGPGWASTDGSGHSELVEELEKQATVRVLESSMSLLPESAGPNDALFLFPSHRTPTPWEVQSIQRFTEDGGRVIVAADGELSAHWLSSLGGTIVTTPLASQNVNKTNSCLDAAFAMDGWRVDVCLPSPALMAPAEEAGNPAVTIGRLLHAAGIDFDGDRRLDIEDRPEGNYSVGIRWEIGDGELIVVSDGDLWRNRAVESETNAMALAINLAQNRTRVFVDSASHSANLGIISEQATRAFGDPTSSTGASLAAAFVGILLLASMASKHQPWRPHERRIMDMHPEVVDQARRDLDESIHKEGE